MYYLGFRPQADNELYLAIKQCLRRPPPIIAATQLLGGCRFRFPKTWNQSTSRAERLYDNVSFRAIIIVQLLATYYRDRSRGTESR